MAPHSKWPEMDSEQAEPFSHVAQYWAAQRTSSNWLETRRLHAALIGGYQTSERGVPLLSPLLGWPWHFLCCWLSIYSYLHSPSQPEDPFFTCIHILTAIASRAFDYLD
jgi:hypothetical protein